MLRPRAHGELLALSGAETGACLAVSPQHTVPALPSDSHYALEVEMCVCMKYYSRKEMNKIDEVFFFSLG